jgi:hypothetical protein
VEKIIEHRFVRKHKKELQNKDEKDTLVRKNKGTETERINTNIETK